MTVYTNLHAVVSVEGLDNNIGLCHSVVPAVQSNVAVKNQQKPQVCLDEKTNKEPVKLFGFISCFYLFVFQTFNFLIEMSST